MPKRPDDDIEQCSSCRHWREDMDPGNERSGECRSGPPTLFYEAGQGAWSMWPITAHTDDCGAYKQRVQ